MLKEKTIAVSTLRNIVMSPNRTNPKVYYKVMKGNTPVGVFLNYQNFQNLLENLAELSDIELTSSVKEARNEIAYGKGRFLEDVI